MHIVSFAEAAINPETGNRMLVPRDITDTIEVGLVRKAKGEITPLGCHPDEEEAYLILKGKALLKLGDREQEVGAGTAVYVPRGVPHQMTALSDEGLEYVYFANWPAVTPGS